MGVWLFTQTFISNLRTDFIKLYRSPQGSKKGIVFITTKYFNKEEKGGAVITRSFFNYMHERIGEERTKEILGESEKIWGYIRGKIGYGRYWQITRDEVRVLYSLVTVKTPQTVIETGMGPGTSTTTILSALPPGGRLISIDPGEPYGKGDREVGFVIPENLRTNLTYVKGRSSEKLVQVLRTTGKVDIFFHDSDHSYENVLFELKTVFPFLSKDFLIILDNYDWSDAPGDFARERGLRLKHVADDMAIITE